MKSKKTMYILCLVFILIAFFSGYQIIMTMSEYKTSTDTYNSLKEYVNNEDIFEEKDDSFVTVDFSSLREINPDTVAWIYIEDTNINYPVVQGNDNDYYLNHLVDRTYNSSGSIFLDYRNQDKFTDRHNIIYGHNMVNGSMFANLDKYKEQEYYNNHPSYELVTPEKNYKIEIFSGYVASVNEDTWKLNFGSNEEFQNWINWTKEKSLFESNVAPTTEDKIITLSTCSYEFDNARFVLIGILKEY